MPIPILERSDGEISRLMERKVRAIREVDRCNVISITSTRKKPSVHLLAVLRGNPSYEQTHVICSKIGIVARHVLSNVNLAIFSESSELQDEEEKAGKIVKSIADEEPGFRGSQNIHVRGINEKLGVDFTILEADTPDSFHSRPTSRIQEKILASDSRIEEVIIHDEPLSDLIRNQRAGHGGEAKWYIEHVVWRFPEFELLRPPDIQRFGDQLRVGIKVADHSSAQGTSRDDLAKLESAIRNGYPAISRVTVSS